MVRTLLALVLTALLVPAFAAAKGSIAEARVCGAAGCVTIDGPDQELGAGGDGIAEPAPRPQPYHTLRLTIDSPRPRAWDVLWIGGASTVAYRGESGMHFERLTLAAAAAMREATRGVEPFPAPSVTWRALADRRGSAVGTTGEAGFDWALVSGTLAAVLAVAGVGGLLVRRARRPAVA